MEIDFSTLNKEASYKLITGAVVPRPIAWITSGIEPGRINLAPFSAFTFVSTYPPMLGFNCGAREGLRKDTSRNIHAHGEYVIHIADQPLLEALHLSSEHHPPDVSEVELLGLETVPSTVIRTPRLARAPISLECKLSEVLSFGNKGNEFFVGAVVRMHIRDDLYRDGKIDARSLNPVCRIGGPTYASLGDVFSLKPVKP
ncbi:MAG: flavin reductase family protein [Burkholderiaceae bacterium]|nr:flavin reductase family protein [Burkholderiaceae bacterium]MDO9089017.1 flavin reductase family protein [Burkholderiaceae bacterium]MDP1968352.1 flavin reductase family protein [Burkholderiaceae bacterium]